ncbi:type II secretion system F family protein [Pedococcus sp.]|uniref:type II secretion system F family protein n=1 Tax=Pedococcus sp. TaxID=2860345 RepID=UPI002E137BAD|nr:type II secretion system F family protein [Pedococcus sp.]
MSVPWVLMLLAVLAVSLWPSGAWPAAREASRPTAGEAVIDRCRSLVRPVRHLSLFSRAEQPTAVEVADTLELLSLAVRSGLGLTEALHHVQRCSVGSARRDLAAVVAALRWGRPAGEAWTYGGRAWRAAALAWAVAEETGAPAAELLHQAAVRQREADDRAAERRTARAGVLLVLPLGLGFLPSFACVAVVPVLLVLARGVLGG